MMSARNPIQLLFLESRQSQLYYISQILFLSFKAQILVLICVRNAKEHIEYVKTVLCCSSYVFQYSAEAI